MMRKITLTLLVFCSFLALSSQDIEVKLSPNPTSSSVQIALNGLVKGPLIIEIYSVIGTKISSTTYPIDAENTEIVLYTGKLQEGVYLVKIFQGENSVVKRLRVQHS